MSDSHEIGSRRPGVNPICRVAASSTRRYSRTGDHRNGAASRSARLLPLPILLPLLLLLSAVMATPALGDDDATPAPSVVERAAAALARPAFSAHCSTCHGADGRGRRERGAPNLMDEHWVWDDATADGPVPALEDTIRYGIRSGHAKARNVTAMPAFGHGGELGLTASQIDDLVVYVTSLAGDNVDAAARRRGRALYAGRANCVECHSADGTGNADWGAPDLTVADDAAWLYGRDRASLTRTITEGRAGRCPAWIDRLDPPTIHALALWLRSGHGQPAP